VHTGYQLETGTEVRASVPVGKYGDVMTVDVMISLRGEYVCGSYVEFGYQQCFDCPFDDCTDANAASIGCPRRREELAKLRADGIIPSGYLVREELAGKLGVATRNLKPLLDKHPIPSIIHRVGKLKWRLFPNEAVNAALGAVDVNSG